MSQISLSGTVYWKDIASDFEEANQPGVYLEHIAYFSNYIPEDIFIKIASATNRKYLLEKGSNLNVTAQEIKVFFGITVMMSYLKFPKIMNYWQQKTRIPAIADKMSRTRYFKLRSNLEIVNDDNVTEKDKTATKFWKIKPLITSVRNGCLLNSTPKEACIGKQLISFNGNIAGRPVIKTKRNYGNLQIFVMTSSDGLPLDFILYEGKDYVCKENGIPILNEEEVKTLGTGGKIVMRLSNRLASESTIYMDKYFTSVPLLKLLRDTRQCSATGMLKNNKIPKNCNLESDSDLSAQGRGSYSQDINSEIAIIKWFDEKPVTLTSSRFGAEPIDICQKWDKKLKRFIEITRPAMVKEYNEKIGGVELLNRLIGSHRISAKTTKPTIRLMFHLFDFAIAASWIEYRRDHQETNTPKGDILDYVGYREYIADALMTETETEIKGEINTPGMSLSIAQPKRARVTQHPPDHVRRSKADHFPEPITTQKRCRFPGCSSNKARHLCPTCNVVLCLNSSRNCFKLYHRL